MKMCCLFSIFIVLSSLHNFKGVFSQRNNRMDSNPHDEELGSCTEEARLYPHPLDCTKFTRCVNNRILTFSCPPRTAFDPEMQVCTWHGGKDGCRNDVSQEIVPYIGQVDGISGTPNISAGEADGNEKNDTHPTEVNFETKEAYEYVLPQRFIGHAASENSIANKLIQSDGAISVSTNSSESIHTTSKVQSHQGSSGTDGITIVTSAQLGEEVTSTKATDIPVREWDYRESLNESKSHNVSHLKDPDTKILTFTMPQRDANQSYNIRPINKSRIESETATNVSQLVRNNRGIREITNFTLIDDVNRELNKSITYSGSELPINVTKMPQNDIIKTTSDNDELSINVTNAAQNGRVNDTHDSTDFSNVLIHTPQNETINNTDFSGTVDVQIMGKESVNEGTLPQIEENVKNNTLPSVQDTSENPTKEEDKITTVVYLHRNETFYSSEASTSGSNQTISLSNLTNSGPNSFDMQINTTSESFGRDRTEDFREFHPNTTINKTSVLTSERSKEKTTPGVSNNTSSSLLTNSFYSFIKGIPYLQSLGNILNKGFVVPKTESDETQKQQASVADNATTLNITTEMYISTTIISARQPNSSNLPDPIQDNDVQPRHLKIILPKRNVSFATLSIDSKSSSSYEKPTSTTADPTSKTRTSPMSEAANAAHSDDKLSGKKIPGIVIHLPLPKNRQYKENEEISNTMPGTSTSIESTDSSFTTETVPSLDGEVSPITDALDRIAAPYKRRVRVVPFRSRNFLEDFEESEKNSPSSGTKTPERIYRLKDGRKFRRVKLRAKNKQSSTELRNRESNKRESPKRTFYRKHSGHPKSGRSNYRLQNLETENSGQSTERARGSRQSEFVIDNKDRNQKKEHKKPMQPDRSRNKASTSYLRRGDDNQYSTRGVTRSDVGDDDVNFKSVPFLVTGERTSFQCPRIDGHYVDPEDCSVFYHCDNGVAYRRDCPKGQVFHQKAVACVSMEVAPPCSSSHKDSKSPCEKSLDGVYSDKGDCTHYYECTGGMSIRRKCMSGTVFDPILGKCTWSQFVPGCRQERLFTESSISTEKEEFKRNLPAEIDAQNHDLHGTQSKNKQIQKRKQNSLPEPFVCPRDGFFRHESRCDVYFLCAEGEALMLTCDPGTSFDPTLNMCVWSQMVKDCDKPSNNHKFARAGEFNNDPPKSLLDSLMEEDLQKMALKSQSGPSVSLISSGSDDENFVCPDAHGIFADTYNCTAFIHCFNGVPYRHFCQPGTAYSPESGACTWKYLVQHCRGGGSLKQSTHSHLQYSQRNGKKHRHYNREQIGDIDDTTLSKHHSYTDQGFAQETELTEPMSNEIVEDRIPGYLSDNRQFDKSLEEKLAKYDASMIKDALLLELLFRAKDRLNSHARIKDAPETTQDSPVGLQNLLELNRRVKADEKISRNSLARGFPSKMSEHERMWKKQRGRVAQDTTNEEVNVSAYSASLDQYRLQPRPQAYRNYPEFQCPPVQDGFFRDDYVCDVFHRCVLGDRYTFVCPPGTFFRVDGNFCDHHETVLDCTPGGLRRGSVPSPPQLLAFNNGPEPAPPLSSPRVLNYYPSTFDSSVNLQTPIAQTRFETPSGQPRIDTPPRQPLIDSTIRQPRINMPIRRQGPNSNNGGPSPNPPPCPSPSGLFAHPANCHQFLFCAHSVPLVLTCPPSLLYNVRTLTCDFAANVVCVKYDSY